MTDGISEKTGANLDDMDKKVNEGVSQIHTGILGVNVSGMLSDGESPALLPGDT